MEVKIIKTENITRTMREMKVGQYFKRSALEENVLRRNASVLKREGYEFEVTRVGIEITVTCVTTPAQNE